MPPMIGNTSLINVLPLLILLAAAIRALSFDPVTGTFKILQFADLHYGEGENESWGPEQDIHSTRVINNVLGAENPDLVVYTGDQITGNNIRKNATAYWAELIAPVIASNHRWAFVFGNHDDLPLEKSRNGNTLDPLSSTSRMQLLSFDNKHRGSLSRNDNSTLQGVSNFHLYIDHTRGTGRTPLFFFDSGGGTIPEYIHQNQVMWYSSLDNDTAGIAFMHIPLAQYALAYEVDEGCFGMDNDDISIQNQDTGLFSAFLVRKNVRAVFVGHNHGNDWCCPLHGIWLCYGRHSGYGGYGTWKRGGRVIILRENSTAIETYIRMEDGSMEHHGIL